jgi:hypothetical protein
LHRFLRDGALRGVANRAAISPWSTAIVRSAGPAGKKNDKGGSIRYDAVRHRGVHELMIGSKRFIRAGFVFSVVGHVGGLLLGMFFVGAGAVPPPPPEAMTIEIVSSNEAPQIEMPPTENTQVDGTPLDSTSSGSEVSSDSDKGSATAERPRPKMVAPPSPEQAKSLSNPQRTASLAAAQPQAPPDEPQPETQPQASEPLLRPTMPTVEPQPHPEEAAHQPKPSEMFAMPLALPGGRLGGGFDAPAAKPAMLPHDDTAAFRARVSSCSRLPAGMVDEKVAIVLRISFKRDGTLASEPELVDSTLSPDALPLMQSAINALQRCQPFTELPPDKYKKWKTMELVVTPLALAGR